MPPSPSLRCSPGREQRMENTHKRGQSFESGLTLKAKDDDLALFSDMQNKESDSFLLHTIEDFDDSLSKLRYLSDFKLDVTIPARGESSDLLNADGDKNDYDWLLTPPDTPLFPSLDDEEPQSHNLLHRGRPRSQPINISRSLSMNEKPQRNSRSSASPRRLSPSPRSGNQLGQMISRPSSAPRSSPPPVTRPVTPSRRPSTPNKASTPNSRSSTPTLRRMSTGSSGQATPSGRRGTSPMRTSRGNSASPKLRGWQSNLPGFSSEVPPNLRTSVSDRPLPQVRGLSPTPRSERSRQSMSPTASRSASSSHSNDRDFFSSYSKGSVVSSGDDDVDSLHSMTISRSPPARRNGMPVNNRPMAFSKKSSRNSPSNSVPRRSIDSVPRQMDHRKAPQNMFRPLLSSVPSSTFYVGTANNMHRHMFSRNSSLTTSTSASSDQGASVAPDMDATEPNHNDLTGEWERIQDPGTQEEVFMFDKVDMIEDDTHESLPKNSIGLKRFDANKVNVYDVEGPKVNFSGAASVAAVAETRHAAGNPSVVNGCEILSICSKCGRRYRMLELDGKTDLCQDCEEIDRLLAAEPFLIISATQNETVKSEVSTGINLSINEVQLNVGVSELPEGSSGDICLGRHDNNVEESSNCLGNDNPVHFVMDQSKSHPSDKQLESQQHVSSNQSDVGNKFQQMEPTGISVLLLQGSSSSKWPVMQSRAFSAANILCSEPSYARENTITMKRCIGRDGASASSSLDLGLSRQADIHIQRQMSSKKVELDYVRGDTDAKSDCSDTHFDRKTETCKLSVASTNDTKENSDSYSKGFENGSLLESVLVRGEVDSLQDCMNTSTANFLSHNADFVSNNAHNHADCFPVENKPDFQLLNQMEKLVCETSASNTLKDEGYPSCVNANEYPVADNGNSLDIEVPNNISDSLFTSRQSDFSHSRTNGSFAVILESQDSHDTSLNLQTECGQVPCSEEGFHEQSVSATSEKDMIVSSLESDTNHHVHEVHEESTVIVEGPKGHTSRSLTLAEATDTILFCSSIMHDIAYKAAAIGMEKELVVTPEALRPALPIIGKPVDQKDPLVKTPGKHTPKSQKFKRKKLETPTKLPLTESDNNVIIQGSTSPANTENIPKKAPDSIKPPKLESKCNCTVM